jgi:hypothetical protein
MLQLMQQTNKHTGKTGAVSYRCSFVGMLHQLMIVIIQHLFLFGIWDLPTLSVANIGIILRDR